jgi:hypothetical protein
VLRGDPDDEARSGVSRVHETGEPDELPRLLLAHQPEAPRFALEAHPARRDQPIRLLARDDAIVEEIATDGRIAPERVQRVAVGRPGRMQDQPSGRQKA